MLGTQQFPPHVSTGRPAEGPPGKEHQERNTTSATEHDSPTGRSPSGVGRESAEQDAFSTDIADLPAGIPTPTVQLADGAVFDLRVTPVSKQIGNETVRMLAYNGSVPGPTLRVRQGTEVVVNAANDGDLETTVHWHGLRLDNRFDGTHHTQDPIEPGGTFEYRFRAPVKGTGFAGPVMVGAGPAGCRRGCRSFPGRPRRRPAGPALDWIRRCCSVLGDLPWLPLEGTGDTTPVRRSTPEPAAEFRGAARQFAAKWRPLVRDRRLQRASSSAPASCG